jgi:hypothetical protein
MYRQNVPDIFMMLCRTRQNRTLENLKKLFRQKIVGGKTVVDGKPTVHGPEPKVAALLGLQVPEGQTLTEVAFPSAVHSDSPRYAPIYSFPYIL